MYIVIFRMFYNLILNTFNLKNNINKLLNFYFKNIIIFYY
jgi:hypothetical protein